MNITWREGVTTLAAVGAVVIERAYFHSWNWPLVSSTRWVVTGLAILIAVQYIFNVLLDKTRSEAWFYTGSLLGMISTVLAGLGLIFAVSDYVVLLMLAAITFWFFAILTHLVSHSPAPHVHA